MLRHNSGAILRQMQALLGAGTFTGLSDQQLLEEFLERRDEVAELAFAVLVERHGPMVLGVCRRIMGDPHDAEDAFQATFLVLARKGHSIRVEGSLGRWLFGVATRVATRARTDERRRRARERPGLDRLEATGPDATQSDIDRAEIQAIIAMEIAGLPARFQAAVLLCDLEGRSYEEAARRLGWPLGTVKSRLARGRARLRERLTRRGLAPADSSIATALLPAAPSPVLVETTTHAASALIAGRLATAGIVSTSVTTLTQGVLRTMTYTKLKLAAIALLVVATGSAALFGQAAAQKSDRGTSGRIPPAALAKVGASAGSDESVDLEMLERAWVDAITRRDAAVINRIMADDFEGIDPVGNVYSKATYLPDLRNGVFNSAPIELDQMKTRIFGETGFVTSRVKLQTSPKYGRMTKIYVKRDGRWQCVASHECGVSGTNCPAIAKAGGREALGDWLNVQKRLGTPLWAETKNSCVACHVTNVHPAPPLPHPVGGTPAIQPDQVTNVRPPIKARVEKIHVAAGAAVKKGDPLIELFSTELATAKAEYETALSQWQRDKKVYDYKKPLVESNTSPRSEFIDVENDLNQSQLKLKLARDKLLICGLPDAEIGKKELGLDNARLTLRAPVDGVVVAVHKVVGNFSDPGDTMVEIRATPAQSDRKP